MTLTTATENFDPIMFRTTVGHYASGITIITGRDDDGPIGFTCQSFYSVSVDPPLVSFSVMKTSTTYPRIRATGAFAVNILSHRQEAVSSQFARRGTEKWADIEWTSSERGNPLLEGSLAWLDCTVWAEHDAGDHRIVIGRVVDVGTSIEQDPSPLLYFKGQYDVLQAASRPRC